MILARSRKCCGCRQCAEKDQLIRVVSMYGKLEVDELKRKDGRGVYFHPSMLCVNKGISRKLLERALRTTLLDQEIEGLKARLLAQLTNELV